MEKDGSTRLFAESYDVLCISLKLDEVGSSFWDVNVHEEIENMGGHLNAYTSREQTVLLA